ncbi:hypothetical protein EV182_002788 [Spiromyces aspiralis]|uniref:Uncharacterized protein n=1 Tax=Spiromyces aspiralis TaxID=68401 RepID=A0ACC1HL94_9FUNG|nr:hypothetical protein EV182_002788 [Spiromyces aspiralis]
MVINHHVLSDNEMNSRMRKLSLEGSRDYTASTDPDNSGNHTTSNNGRDADNGVHQAAPHLSLSSLLQASLAKHSGPAIEESPIRSLKDQLIDPTDIEENVLIEMLGKEIADGGGEALFEVGKEEDESSMMLNDDDVARITATLKRLTSSPELNASCTLILDRGKPGNKPPIYARDVPEVKPSSKARRKDTSDSKSGALANTTGTHAKEPKVAVACPARAAEPCSPKDRTVSYLIRKKSNSIDSILEVRVAVAGNVDAGKSTLLGVLTKGQLDDGRGRARINMFRHKHEVESGRTSSVGLEILGFDKDTCEPITTSAATGSNRKLSWVEVCARSSKIISFSDLAGHEKYLKTTVFGITSNAPEFMMLMVGANAGVIGMTKEHLGLALALSVPVMVVVSKIDMCPPNVFEHTLQQLNRVLRSSGCRKHPIFVHNSEDVITTSRYFPSGRICPVFQVSNCTGEGIDYLTQFLNLLPTSSGGGSRSSGGSFMFEINETFSVPFVGTVASGIVKSGMVDAGDPVWIGPDPQGQFWETVVKTIQRKRVSSSVAYAGQSVSFALKRVKRSQIRKGMVLVGKEDGTPPPRAHTMYEAEILVLFHSATICPRYQAMLHCNSVRQTARIVSIQNDKDALRTGDRATIKLQFICQPEFISPGSRFIFREGRTRAVGKITRAIGPEEERDIIRKATNGTMVFDPRVIKSKRESLRHGHRHG